MYGFEDLMKDEARWKKVQKRMEKVSVKSLNEIRVATEGMSWLGIPYYELKLQNLVTEYCDGAEIEDDEGSGHGERCRVHLNKIPYRLLCALHHISPDEEQYPFLEWLDKKTYAREASDYPFNYSQRERGTLVRVDGRGHLLELPPNLDAALRSGVDLNKFLQPDITAFYAPLRVREILYYTAPEDERNWFLLDDCECQRLADEDISLTDSMLRFRLLERKCKDGQIMDIDDQLFNAILCGEVASEEELMEFDR